MRASRYLIYIILVVFCIEHLNASSHMMIEPVDVVSEHEALIARRPESDAIYEVPESVKNAEQLQQEKIQQLRESLGKVSAYTTLDPAKVAAQHEIAYPKTGYHTKMTTEISNYVTEIKKDAHYTAVVLHDPEALDAFVIGFKRQLWLNKRSPEQFLTYVTDNYPCWADPTGQYNALTNVAKGLKFLNTLLANPEFKYASPENNKLMQKPMNDYIAALRKEWSHVSDTTLATCVTVLLNDKKVQMTPLDLVNAIKKEDALMEKGDLNVGELADSQLTDSQKMVLTIRGIEDVNANARYNNNGSFLSTGGLYLLDPALRVEPTKNSSDGIEFIDTQSNQVSIAKKFEQQIDILPIMTDKKTPGINALVDIMGNLSTNNTGSWFSWLSQSIDLSHDQKIDNYGKFTENVKKVYGYGDTLSSQELAFVKLSKDIKALKSIKQTTTTTSALQYAENSLFDIQQEIAQKEISRLLLGTDLSVVELSQQLTANIKSNNGSLLKYNKNDATKIKSENELIIADQYDDIYKQATKLLDVMNEKLRSNIPIDQARKLLQQAKNASNGNFDTIIVLQKVVNELTNRSENKVNINKIAQSIWTESTTALQAVQNNNVISKVKPTTDPVVFVLRDLKQALSVIETSEIENQEKYDEVLTDVDIFTAQYNKATKSVDINQRIRATDNLIENLRAAKNKNPEFLDLTLYLEVIENKLKPRLELIANCTNDLSKTKEDLAANLNKIKELKGKLNSSNIKQQIVELNKLINGSTMVLSKDLVSVDDLKILYDQLELELQEKQNQENPWYENWNTLRKGYGQVSEGNIIPGTGKILYAGSLGVAGATTQSLLDHTTSALHTIGLGPAWANLDKTEEGRKFKQNLIDNVFTPAIKLSLGIIALAGLSQFQKEKNQHEVLSAVIADVATNLIAYQTGASPDVVEAGNLEAIMFSGAINKTTNSLTGSTTPTIPQTLSTKNIDNFKNKFQMQYGIDLTQPVQAGKIIQPRIGTNLSNYNLTPVVTRAPSAPAMNELFMPLDAWPSKPTLPYSPYTSSPYVAAQ